MMPQTPELDGYISFSHLELLLKRSQVPVQLILPYQ